MIPQSLTSWFSASPNKTTGPPSKVYDRNLTRVPELNDWLSSESSEGKNLKSASLVFKAHLFPFLSDYPKLLAPRNDSDVADGNEWIDKLMRGDIHEEELRQSWKENTVVLTRTVNHTFAQIITELYGIEINRRKDDLSLGKFNVNAPPPSYVAGDDNCDVELEILSACFYKAHKNAFWEKMCGRIQDLCHELGVPGPLFALPLHNVELMKHCILYEETDNLRKEYRLLLETLGKQEKIINTLSYRHIMEHLAQDANGKAWETFWKKAYDEAKHSKTSNPSHPVVKVFQALSGTADVAILDTGRYLYNSLSTNIHKFDNATVLDSGRWDAITKTILEALQPTKKKFNVETGIEEWDWALERKKYF